MRLKKRMHAGITAGLVLLAESFFFATAGANSSWLSWREFSAVECGRPFLQKSEHSMRPEHPGRFFLWSTHYYPERYLRSS